MDPQVIKLYSQLIQPVKDAIIKQILDESLDDEIIYSLSNELSCELKKEPYYSKDTTPLVITDEYKWINTEIRYKYKLPIKMIKKIVYDKYDSIKFIEIIVIYNDTNYITTNPIITVYNYDDLSLKTNIFNRNID